MTRIGIIITELTWVVSLYYRGAIGYVCVHALMCAINPLCFFSSSSLIQ